MFRHFIRVKVRLCSGIIISLVIALSGWANFGNAKLHAEDAVNISGAIRINGHNFNGGLRLWMTPNVGTGDPNSILGDQITSNGTFTISAYAGTFTLHLLNTCQPVFSDNGCGPDNTLLPQFNYNKGHSGELTTVINLSQDADDYNIDLPVMSQTNTIRIVDELVTPLQNISMYSRIDYDGQTVTNANTGKTFGLSGLHEVAGNTDGSGLVTFSAYPDVPFGPNGFRINFDAPVNNDYGNQTAFFNPTPVDKIYTVVLGLEGMPAPSTPPNVGDFSWSNNPKSQSQTATFSVSTDDHGLWPVVGGEYYLADFDPGTGNGTSLSWDGTKLNGSIGANLEPGIYKVNARATDEAGHWSDVSSDYLVVYAAGGSYVRGGRSILPLLTNGDMLPGLTNDTQTNKLKFGMNVKYNQHNQITNRSAFQFSYSTGTRCANPVRAQNCHVTNFISDNISWLISQGRGLNTDTFQGTGMLTVDGVQSQVIFQVTAYDGSEWGGNDQFEVKIYSQGANPQIADPAYIVHLADIHKGDIKIAPQNPPISD